MPSFVMLDSNTSQKVTISVLGHVVVSQMGIVQVPYATVTGKYVRALRIKGGGKWHHWWALAAEERRPKEVAGEAP